VQFADIVSLRIGEVKVGGYFHIAGISAGQNGLADFVCADADDFGKLFGGCFKVGNCPRLCKDSVDFVAGGKNPAPAIEHCAAAGAVCYGSLLSFGGKFPVVVSFEMLEIKTPASHRCNSGYESNKNKK
jgi:hypothetical protein